MSPSALQVVDTQRRQLIGSLSHPSDEFTYDVQPLPGKRWIASFDPGLWLQDTARRCASIHPAAPRHRTIRVLVRPDGKQLIDVGRDTTVRIYRQRRAPSVLGDFVLPETWGIYLAAIAMVVGAARIAAMDFAGSAQRLPPRALRIALILAAVTLGITVADQSIAAATHAVYEAGPAPTFAMNVWHWGLLALAMTAVLGAARMRRGWWITLLILLACCILLAAIVGGILLVGVIKLGSGVIVTTIPWHGVPLSLFSPVLLLLSGVQLILPIAPCWLLTRREVRALYPARRRQRRGVPRGFDITPSASG